MSGMVYWNDSHDPINWEDLAGNELDGGTMNPYDTLHKWFSYPRYIDLPTVLGFDRFYVAHQEHAHIKEDMQKFINVAKNATREKSKPYDSWPQENPRIYEENGVAVVFNERTLG